MNASKLFAAFALSFSLPFAAAAQSNKAAGHALQLDLENGHLRVYGEPDDKVAIMFGLERTEVMLPGQALLSVVPMVIAEIAEFDAQGQYEMDIREWLRTSEPFNAFAQAISIGKDSGEFSTSNVQELNAPERVKPQDGDDDRHADDDGVDRVGTKQLDPDRKTYGTDDDGRDSAKKHRTAGTKDD